MIYPYCVKNGPIDILKKAGVSYTKLPARTLYEIALIAAEIYSEGMKDGILYGQRNAPTPDQYEIEKTKGGDPHGV
jgi:hypothetical protein